MYCEILKVDSDTEGRDETLHPPQPAAHVRIYDVVARTIIHIDQMSLTAHIFAMGQRTQLPSECQRQKSRLPGRWM